MQSVINMKKTFTSLLCLLFGGIVMCAQTRNSFDYQFPEKKSGLFNKMDVALTLGSTGVGIDVASPVTDFMQVRAGFSFMPKFEYKMNFPIEVGEGTREEQQSKFEQLSGMLEQFTGHAVNDNVDMIGEPTFYNFKLLFDFFPLQDKRWHVTAGFYAGPSRIGKAYNTTDDMPSLFAVKMYNHMHENITYSYENDLPWMEIDGQPLYVSDLLMEKMNYYGRMGIGMGQKADGTTYRMEPDEKSMVSAKMKVNSFRPYLGFGYGSSMMNNNSKYSISFDCGVLFWGGTPSVLTHDGTNLSKDVKNIPGKVGDYVDMAKQFKVFPVIEVRISRRLF